MQIAMKRTVLALCQQCFTAFQMYRQLSTSTCLSITALSLRLSQQKMYDIHQEPLSKPPDMPENPKRLRVGVIGMPNVGKSTLINTLTGKNLMATSSRIDTTQDNILAVLTEDNVQIEFQDTPGIHSHRKAKKIAGHFRNSHLPSECIEKADLAMVVADLSEKRTSRGFLQPEIMLHLMKFMDVPAILVLNKIDRLSKKMDVLPLIPQLTANVVDGVPIRNEETNAPVAEPISLPEIKTSVLRALDQVEIFESASDISLANKTEAKILKQLRHCRGWPHFKEVFVISALKGSQTEKLKTYLKSRALSQPWNFHSDVLTDASPRDIVKNAFRSSMLENLAEEVPYVANVFIADWEEADGLLSVRFDVVCKRVNHLRFVENAAPILCFGVKKRLESVLPIDVEADISVYTEREYSRHRQAQFN